MPTEMMATRAITKVVTSSGLIPDPGFLTALRAHCKSPAPMFDPGRERKAWRDLLAEL